MWVANPTAADLAFDKVEAAGRSASLLNIDWIARNARGYGPHAAKVVPAGGYINAVWSAPARLPERESAHRENTVRIQRGQYDALLREKRRKRLLFIMAENMLRAQNQRFQTVRLACLQIRIFGERRLQLSTPLLRRADGDNRGRKMQKNGRTVHFASVLCTKVRVLSQPQFNPELASRADVYRTPEDGAEPHCVTEHAHSETHNMRSGSFR
jgi:hypothetical protein